MIRIDLHMHTSASFDCSADPADVARRCLRLGLSPIVVTDHDTIDGALQLWRGEAFRIVVGEEISTSQGELIGLFLESAVPPGLSARETVLRIKAQGGIVYLQHPYDAFRRRLPEATIEEIGDRIDIVEVWNGRSPADANERAQDLCATLGATAGAGSDAHDVAEIGGVFVEMEDFEGAEDFLAKLGSGRVVVRPNRLLMRARALKSRRGGR